jgi:hypothetical protein
VYFFAGLVTCEVVLSYLPPIYTLYSSLIGIAGLSIEATLPIPQILANHQSRSCKGFRLSVLASWLAGDAMKMFWFFTATTEIPWAFKVCGMFQAACDSYLGIQYWMYGDGGPGPLSVANGAIKEHPMADMSFPTGSPYNVGKQPSGREHSRSLTPTRRPATFQVAAAE